MGSQEEYRTTKSEDLDFADDLALRISLKFQNIQQ